VQEWHDLLANLLHVADQILCIQEYVHVPYTRVREAPDLLHPIVRRADQAERREMCERRAEDSLSRSQFHVAGGSTAVTTP